MVKNIWHDAWRVLNTDVTEFFTQDTCKDYLEAVGSLYELGENPEELGPFLGQMNSLLDVLDSPIGKMVEASLPFLPLVTGILTFYVEKNRKEPSLEVCIALVSQGAYLQSMQRFLEERPAIYQQFNQEKASQKLQKEINKLGEKLELNGEEFTIDDKEGRKVLVCFHESKLAQVFNQLLTRRFQEGGLKKKEAETLTERISRSTHRYLKRAFAEAGDAVKKLASLYGSDWQREEEAYLSIDSYLEEVIAKKPQETVFDEEFTFQDIYVPLEVKTVQENGEVDEEADPENIEDWALNLLEDKKKQGNVLFIQGGPGRGKSVFCRMFAERIRRELYPIWIPILIRLRDIITFEFNFDNTLRAALGWNFANSDDGWLTDRNTRFLFLLDGFDELLLERGANQGLQEFLDQVAKFQRQCQENKERGHRVIITGRPLALYGIERLMPRNLERVAILTMSETIQGQWLNRWEKVVDADATKAKEKTKNFQGFLKEKRCPRQVTILAQEPLLLYLLAAMHRDDILQAQMFAEDNPTDPKVLIYEKAINWVLTKQRSEGEENLNQKITGLEPEDLRSILGEAGLCVVQSGREFAAVATIEDRLTAKEDEAAKELLETARERKEKNPLKNALAAFYLKLAPGAENCVEFFHKSFGEFLCAERIAESLWEWTQKAGKRRKTYVISTKEMEWQIYDLFGYGALTPEVVGYLTPLLIQSQPDFVALFERLNDFYLRWSDGEFIEPTEETLPQRKGRQLQKYGVDRGQRQVDIYTGLNVLILLLELHRYGQSTEDLKDKIAFHPCGQPDTEDFEEQRLLRLIGYSDCLGVFSFSSLVINFLSNANLRKADLSDTNISDADLNDTNLSDTNLSYANLSDTNISDANLSYANLRNTDLSGADLRKANLSYANLHYTNLSNANLRKANLSYANLHYTNLSYADLSYAKLGEANLSKADFSKADFGDANLSDANLSDANLSYANLRNVYISDIKWDKDTRWANAIGLHKANNIPEALAQEANFQAAVELSHGYDLVKEGKIEEALAAYEKAQQLDPQLKISAQFWNCLCWHGCLHGYAAEVLFAGEKLLEVEPDNKEWQDTRGLAKALTGDIPEAIEDFQAVVDSNLFDRQKELKAKRERWLAALKQGNNPFTPEEMEALRKSEE